MEKVRLGFALTGSFCTWSKVVPAMAELAKTYDIIPILSPISYISDNRFGKAKEWIDCYGQRWEETEYRNFQADSLLLHER